MDDAAEERIATIGAADIDDHRPRGSARAAWPMAAAIGSSIR
jgi:hypothetical protein